MTRLQCLIDLIFLFKQNDTFTKGDSLKGDLIPYIVKKQSARPPAHISDSDKPMSFVHVNMQANDIFNFLSQSDLERKITETSLFNDSCNRNPFCDDLIRCYVLNPQDGCFGIRVNTLPSYCAINQKVNLIGNRYFMGIKWMILIENFFSFFFFRYLNCGKNYSH